MLRRMLKWAVAAAVAVVCVPAFAEETSTASVCNDGTWPEMTMAAPPIALEQHAETEALVEAVASRVTIEEAVPETEDAAHVHQLANVDDVVEQDFEP